MGLRSPVYGIMQNPRTTLLMYCSVQKQMYTDTVISRLSNCVTVLIEHYHQRVTSNKRNYHRMMPFWQIRTYTLCYWCYLECLEICVWNWKRQWYYSQWTNVSADIFLYFTIKYIIKLVMQSKMAISNREFYFIVSLDS